MIPVEEYKKRLKRTLGFVSPTLIKEYAEARRAWNIDKREKSGKFNPYTDDPNCKTCKKAKGQAK
jgi:hypothetical protein